MALNVNNLEGNELSSGDYARKAASQGRWSETWGIVKSSFGKLVLINIFVLLSFVPGIAVMVFRTFFIGSFGALGPFNAGTGTFYPLYPDTQGLAENITLTADLLSYSLLIVAGFIASVGISGGLYSVKKLVNTGGQFTVKGFFHGVKVCYFNTVLPVTVFLVFLFATVAIGDWKDMVIARGGSAGGPITAYVFIIIATVLAGLYCAWQLAVGASYRLKFIQLIKNTFVLLVATPLHTVFFAGFALLPVWLYMIGAASSFIRMLSYVVFIFVGFSFVLVVWMSFTQWVFDMYVTPNYKAAQEELNAKKTPKELAAEKEEEDKRAARELLAAGRSELIGKPILPISESPAIPALGLTFNRSDVSKAAENRAKLGEEISAYEKEHMSDPVYAEYNKLFAEREKALKPEGKKNKKKKVSADNLLR